MVYLEPVQLNDRFALPAQLDWAALLPRIENNPHAKQEFFPNDGKEASVGSDEHSVCRDFIFVQVPSEFAKLKGHLQVFGIHDTELRSFASHFDATVQAAMHGSFRFLLLGLGKQHSLQVLKTLAVLKEGRKNLIFHIEVCDVVNALKAQHQLHLVWHLKSKIHLKCLHLCDSVRTKLHMSYFVNEQGKTGGAVKIKSVCHRYAVVGINMTIMDKFHGNFRTFVAPTKLNVDPGVENFAFLAIECPKELLVFEECAKEILTEISSLANANLGWPFHRQGNSREVLTIFAKLGRTRDDFSALRKHVSSLSALAKRNGVFLQAFVHNPEKVGKLYLCTDLQTGEFPLTKATDILKVSQRDFILTLQDLDIEEHEHQCLTAGLINSYCVEQGFFAFTLRKHRLHLPLASGGLTHIGLQLRSIDASFINLSQKFITWLATTFDLLHPSAFQLVTVNTESGLERVIHMQISVVDQTSKERALSKIGTVFCSDEGQHFLLTAQDALYTFNPTSFVAQGIQSLQQHVEEVKATFLRGGSRQVKEYLSIRSPKLEASSPLDYEAQYFLRHAFEKLEEVQDLEHTIARKMYWPTRRALGSVPLVFQQKDQPCLFFGSTKGDIKDHVTPETSELFPTFCVSKSQHIEPGCSKSLLLSGECVSVGALMRMHGISSEANDYVFISMLGPVTIRFVIGIGETKLGTVALEFISRFEAFLSHSDAKKIVVLKASEEPVTVSLFSLPCKPEVFEDTVDEHDVNEEAVEGNGVDLSLVHEDGVGQNFIEGDVEMPTPRPGDRIEGHDANSSLAAPLGRNDGNHETAQLAPIGSYPSPGEVKGLVVPAPHCKSLGHEHLEHDVDMVGVPVSTKDKSNLLDQPATVHDGKVDQRGDSCSHLRDHIQDHQQNQQHEPTNQIMMVGAQTLENSVLQNEKLVEIVETQSSASAEATVHSLLPEDLPSHACHVAVAFAMLKFAGFRRCHQNPSVDHYVLRQVAHYQTQVHPSIKPLLVGLARHLYPAQGRENQDALQSYSLLADRIYEVSPNLVHTTVTTTAVCPSCQHHICNETTEVVDTQLLRANKNLASLAALGDIFENGYVDEGGLCPTCKQQTLLENVQYKKLANCLLLAAQVGYNKDGLPDFAGSRLEPNRQTHVFTRPKARAGGGSFVGFRIRAQLLFNPNPGEQHYCSIEVTPSGDVQVYDPLVGLTSATAADLHRQGYRVAAILVELVTNSDYLEDPTVWLDKPAKDYQPPKRVRHGSSVVSRTYQEQTSIEKDATSAAPVAHSKRESVSLSIAPAAENIESETRARRGTERSEPYPSQAQRAYPARVKATQVEPYLLISLFDGSGSTISIITNYLGYAPVAAILAECDEALRPFVADILGISGEHTKWTCSKQGVKVRYLRSVWEVFDESAEALRELLSFAPPGTKIVLVAGSPCQDLTVFGGEYAPKGVLGFTGSRSFHFHVVYFIMHALRALGRLAQLFFVLENAGSMKDVHKRHMLAALGIGQEAIKSIDAGKYAMVSRNRLFVSRSVGYQLPKQQASPFAKGWITLPDLRIGKNRTLCPWLLPRKSSHAGSIVRTAGAYHPNNLLYDEVFFGGVQGLRELLKKNQLVQAMRDCVPDQFVEAFLCIARWDQHTDGIWPRREHDEAARALSDLFENERIVLPFRTPTLAEQLADSELEQHFAELKQLKHLFCTEIQMHIIGNFFKASALVAGIAGKTAAGGLRNFVLGLDCLLLPCDPAPLQTLSNAYSALKQEVRQECLKNGKDGFLVNVQEHPCPSSYLFLLEESFYDKLPLLTIGRAHVSASPSCISLSPLQLAVIQGKKAKNDTLPSLRGFDKLLETLPQSLQKQLKTLCYARISAKHELVQRANLQPLLGDETVTPRYVVSRIVEMYATDLSQRTAVLVLDVGSAKPLFLRPLWPSKSLYVLVHDSTNPRTPARVALVAAQFQLACSKYLSCLKELEGVETYPANFERTLTPPCELQTDFEKCGVLIAVELLRSSLVESVEQTLHFLVQESSCTLTLRAPTLQKILCQGSVLPVYDPGCVQVQQQTASFEVAKLYDPGHFTALMHTTVGESPPETASQLANVIARVAGGQLNGITQVSQFAAQSTSNRCLVELHIENSPSVVYFVKTFDQQQLLRVKQLFDEYQIKQQVKHGTT